MSIEVFLYVLGLILAILAALPPLRTYYLLNAAVVAIAIGLVLGSGAIH
jgi:hypothetical protein